MIVEQTLKERVWMRVIDYMPKTMPHLIKEMETSLDSPNNAIHILFEAFYQAALDEMVDKYEIQKLIQKLMEKYKDLFSKKGM